MINPFKSVEEEIICSSINLLKLFNLVSIFFLFLISIFNFKFAFINIKRIIPNKNIVPKTQSAITL